MSQNETDIQSSSLYSEDLAPIPQTKRTWNTWNYAALWISMSLCIPTYMLASSLIGGGMNWWQASLTIFLGNAIVLIPMILNGHAGAKYGIPFPVFARASFGVKGANIPAMLRAIVACGWFGIQTWIGGFAIYQMMKLWIPSLANLPQIFPTSFGLQTGPAICFFFFWLLNMFVVYLGVESIKKLLVFKAFFLPFAALALLFWAINAGNGLGPILSQPSRFATNGAFWDFFFPALTGMIGFWATLSLNIPDFTRYAKSQKAQINGQAIGLPTSMTLFAFIGVVVTSATMIIYGETIWDPIVLAGKFSSKLLVSIAMIAVAISTLATNIAANIVSPANDFANLTWLVGYSGLLGPIGGIMIADYYFIRKQELNTNELYQHSGQYNFSSGFNWRAITALLLGIIPNIPGFLVTIKVMSQDAVPQWVSHLYNYAWFVGFFVSGVSYILMMQSYKKLV
ncbi:MAG: NCS1 family nucleobase:cation symporter-1 [Chitinophagaceae bacterium]